jgi:hypothetical protein
MSAETELRALLVADSALVALVGTRIAADRIEQGAARPFVVFTRASTEYVLALDSSVAATKAIFEVQCWGDTRVSIEAVADAVSRIFTADARALSERSSGYDAELDLEATTFIVDWWD